MFHVSLFFQLTSQMRAALGLPPTAADINEAIYLQHQQQQQQQDLQREQIRRILMQDHLDQQLAEGQQQHLRAAIGDRLTDVDAQYYRNLLLNQQLQQHQQQQQQRAVDEEYLFRQQQQQQHSAAAAALRYQDEVLRQQRQHSTSALRQQAVQESLYPSDHGYATNGLPGALQHHDELFMANAVSSSNAAVAAEGGPATAAAQDLVTAALQRHQEQLEQQQGKKKATKRQKKKDGKKGKRKYKGNAVGGTKRQIVRAESFDSSDGGDFEDDEIIAIDAPYHLDAHILLEAAANQSNKKPRKGGTMEELIHAADEQDETDGAANALGFFKNGDWPESEIEDGQIGERVANIIETAYEKSLREKAAETLSVGRFESILPALPEEPLLEDEATVVADVFDQEGRSAASGHLAGDINVLESNSLSKLKASPSEPKKKKAILEYPYPVDTWWPSMSGIRRELQEAGETSDEDDFEDEKVSVASSKPSGEPQKFRCKENKIRHRLLTEVEPGVLEKLNHCRIHRVRVKKKKNSSAPELVYCWQVTELYPNDPMVNCSKCGTWRHADCGGHYKPYSTRENCLEPFAAICENCHEEERLLKDFPKGQERIGRQRMEQLRRGLATSAVMRNASYSKHSGTYKWPLGSVSATHIGGHTRSVHARHDKAERTWTDMVSRLGRGYGYRPKDRVRIRTKELERLLVSIEDAESYTDRHNMLLFLLRDTTKDVPIGYEHQPRNIFDPAEDDQVVLKDEAEGEAEETTKELSNCCHQKKCTKPRRFDSLFCSDGCGVLALEMDLLRSLQDASDVHPSVLRLN